MSEIKMKDVLGLPLKSVEGDSIDSHFYYIYDNEENELCFQWLKMAYDDGDSYKRGERFCKQSTEAVCRAVNSHDERTETLARRTKLLERARRFVFLYCSHSEESGEEEDKLLAEIDKELKGA